MTTLRSFAPVFLALLLLCGGCLKYEKDEYPVELDDIKADEAMGELTRSTSYQQVVAETNIPGRPKHSDSEVISDRSLTVPIKTVDGKKVATIGLVSFLNLVQQNDVQYLRYKETLASAEERLRDSLRSYRPVFGGNISASFDPQNGTESQSVNFSLSQSLPWQGSLRMTSNAQRSHGTSPPDTESMSFSSALSLSFDILLRPGGYMEWKEGIIAAERSWIYAQRSFRQQRESYLINKVREYYDTINSLKTLRTEEDKLKDAQNRLEVAKFEYNRGRKSLTAVYIAEENLIATEQAINDKRENYEEQIDDLKLQVLAFHRITTLN
ncbi:MAG: hypothetical protein U5N86_12515 [Planctomycetota bacterium]|nr:hypothetical protein [Planctomycetota bacterium]